MDAIDYDEDSNGNMRPMCLLRPVESTPTEDNEFLACNASKHSYEAEQSYDEEVLREYLSDEADE